MSEETLPDRLIVREDYRRNRSMISEPPGFRRMVFVNNNDDLDCECEYYNEDTGEFNEEVECSCPWPESVYNLPLPWLHYDFEYHAKFKSFEMTQIYISNEPINFENPNVMTTVAPLPNIFEDYICMPDRNSPSRLFLMNRYWESTFSYDGLMEELPSYEDMVAFLSTLPGVGKILSREDLFSWWEELALEQILRVPWTNDVCLVSRRELVL